MKSSNGFEHFELRQNESSSVSSSDPFSYTGSSRRKKYLLVALLVLLLAAALTIGLAVGLSRADDNDGSERSAYGGTTTTSSPSTTASSAGPAPVVLLVSLDGFRASYLSYNVTPTLQRMIREGAHTPRLLSVYPSLTFPNHYSIATGLYPESHGIVDNKMYDVNFQRYYRLGSPEASKPEWYSGEPIWLTAQRHGKKSACYFWVGSDVPVNGEYPNEYRTYNRSVPFTERVDTVLDWLSQPADLRPDLVTLYFSEPDHAGHAHGPGPSEEMLTTLRMVDDTMARLVTGLKDRDLYDNVNIIIVSDHGMSARSCSRQVKLKDFFNTTELRNLYVFSSASGRISNRYKYSRGEFTLLNQTFVSKETILARVSGHPHIAVYEKSHLPKRLHYANNIRIDDVVVKMDDEWVFSKYGSSGSGCSGGTHGWDTRYDTMSGLFIARGPAFKEGVVIPPFENIEIYNLITDVLRIVGAPNNGTRGSLHSILKTPPELNGAGNRSEQHCHPLSATASTADLLRTHCNCSQPPRTSLQFQPKVQERLQPVLVDDDITTSSVPTVCVSDDAHTTVYSTVLHMPLWTSVTVYRKEDITQDADSCLLPSISLSAEERHLFMTYNDTGPVTATALFAATSHCGNTAQSTDVIPMMKSFKKDLWHELWHMVRAVADTSLPPVSITLGPIFDYDFDGIADDVTSLTRFADEGGQVPLPSHYFAVLVRCPRAGQSLSQCGHHLDVLAFVLPSEQNTNGQSRERRLLENVARVRDVELLTGLRFFADPDLDLDPALSAQLRTRVPLTLWKRPGSWGQQDLCSEPGAVQCDASYQPLLLISLDGFRADYLVRYNHTTPTIERLIQCGVHAPYMRSVYPTKTFPNHYSIVTGLYPESHGIVDNNMYDFNLSQKFCLSCDQAKNPAWWGGEPIWLTAKHQGLTTATYFWPGSDVAVHGEYPDHYKTYRNGVAFTDRVQTVLQWLKLPPGERPNFLTLYFDEPDHTGHAVGPDSPEMGEKLAEVDAAIAELMEGLYQQDMHHCTNIIIIADHGMSGVSCDRLIPLSADLSRADLRKMYVYDGPVGRISNRYRYGRTNNVPIDPPQVNLNSILDRLECSEPHMRVYTKKNLPMRHHYTNNPRIDDILLDADDQWLISRSGSTKYCNGGNHGYDNLYASMHALFLAYGPVFKVGVEIEPFENIELYNLMADILDVTPAPNNGTEGVLHEVLRSPPVSPHQDSSSGTTPPGLCDGGDGATTSTAQLENATCNCSRNAPLPASGSSWSAPVGEPVTGSGGPSLCVTRHSDHTLGYNQHMATPAWITFSASLTNRTLPAAEKSASGICVVRDSWLPHSSPSLNATVLQGTDYVPGSLLFGFQDECEAAMASQVVPMLAGFKTGLWRQMEQLVADYSVKYGEIAVTVGPVFNDDATAVWRGRTSKTRLAGGEWPVPTHFFVVLARCGDPDTSSSSSLPCWDSLKLLAFLLPHVDIPSNCQNFGQTLRENVARVRDIELATGLRFFPELPISQSSRLQTFLPTELWEGGDTDLLPPRRPGNWTDQACPPRDHADSKCPSDYQPVLLVSLDGFKPQYLGRGLTPVMDRLLSCGVHAPYMRSVYPTKTFPNHYSIVTGLYPESHGIIDNNMFDFGVSEEKFSISSDIKNDPRWWGGEPIWLTAQKQNVSSASFFWVGSDVPVQGSYPDLFKYYSGSVPYSSRVSTIVEWMGLPADRRPELLMLYFDEPDHQAHISGPFTPPVDAQIQRVDRTLGELMDALYQKDLHHCVNLILLSDHGFSYLSCDQVIEMQDYFNRTERDDLYFYYGPFARVSNTYKRNRNGSIHRYENSPPMSVADVLGHLQCVDHLKAYNKRDLPVRHHYVHNTRIDSVILDPALNWSVSDKVNSRYCTGGSHGWDNTYKAMEALFVGYGPAFKNGETVKPFENIELYNMISDLLGIQPSPNNGTEGSLDHLLWRTFNRTRSAAASYNDTMSPANITSASSFAVCNCSLGNGNWSASTIGQTLMSQNAASIQSATAAALPFGAPLLMTSDMASDVSLLHQPTYVTAYSASRLLPLWVSATISSSSWSKDNRTTNSCAVSDPRLPDKEQCGRLPQLPDKVSFVSLLPLGYDLGPAALLLSSWIPMQNNFYTDVWQPLQSYLSQWSEGYRDLNVIVGPVFDDNRDGLSDTPDSITRFNLSIPTHVFLIAARCEDSGQSVSRCDSVQTLAFVLPQVDTSKKYNCQSAGEYLVDNEARVRDVELITGLQFFPSLPFTQAVAMRTFLPSGLWPVPRPH